MDEAMNILKERKCSLVVKTSNGTINLYYGRGIANLFSILTHDPTMLRDAIVADKIVGKGAAAIMIQGGVRAIRTIMISEPALKLLEGTSISLDYQVVVSNIINHRGDDICPIESICMHRDTAPKCVEAIRTFLNLQSS